MQMSEQCDDLSRKWRDFYANRFASEFFTECRELSKGNSGEAWLDLLFDKGAEGHYVRTVQDIRARLLVTAADSKRTGGNPYFVLYPTNDFMKACLKNFLPDTRVIVVRSQLFPGATGSGRETRRPGAPHGRGAIDAMLCSTLEASRPRELFLFFLFSLLFNLLFFFIFLVSCNTP